MKFLKFERADGAAYIDHAYVRCVLSRTNGGSTIWIEGEWVDVLGTAADVVAAIERAAAGLDEEPVDAPAEAERELLPLWEQDMDGDWSRGPWGTASVWIACSGGRYRGHAGVRASRWCPAVEAAMAAADALAVADGYALPWDSMAPDPSLAAVLDGKRFHVDRTDNVYYGIEPETHESVVLWQRIPVHLRASARSEALAAMARVLRAHGAIVTEAA